MIKIEFLRPIKRSKISFSLDDSKVPSKLPKEVQELIGEMADVGMYVKAYKKIGVVHEAVPFGRIKREVVLQAKEILETLKLKIRQKKKLNSQKQNLLLSFEQQLQSILEEILELSSKYYHHMPKVMCILRKQ